MLPKMGEYLVVTKSLKDVMTLYNLGIPAIAPISENCFLSEAQYHRLKERFKHIILLYDNDRPGLRAMISIKKKFQYEYLENIKLKIYLTFMPNINMIKLLV